MNGHSNETHMTLRKDSRTWRRLKARGVALLGAGLLALALLAGAGMGLASPAARADGPTAVVSPTPPPVRAPARTIAVGGLLGPSCPAGTILVIFDQPVYDRNGLFVIGTTPVPYCVPEDLEPAG